QRATSTTTHPAFIAARLRSPCWRLVRTPSLATARGEKRRPHLRHAATRLTAGFEYTGPPLDRETARRILGKRCRKSRRTRGRAPWPRFGRAVIRTSRPKRRAFLAGFSPGGSGAADNTRAAGSVASG